MAIPDPGNFEANRVTQSTVNLLNGHPDMGSKIWSYSGITHVTEIHQGAWNIDI